MSRNKPRFNDLKDRMIRVMESGADPKASSDEELAKFSTWYLNPAGRPPREASSKRKTLGLVSVAIYPFSIPATEDSIFASTMSLRAANWLKSASAILTASNIIQTPASIAKAKAVKNFFPAQAIYRETTTDAAEQTSKITGRRYTPKSTGADKGYVVPFGTNATGETEVTEAQVALTTAKPAAMMLTFKPEDYSVPADAFSWA